MATEAPQKKRLWIGGKNLSVGDIAKVAYEKVTVVIDPKALEAVRFVESKAVPNLIQSSEINATMCGSTDTFREEELFNDAVVRATLTVRVARLLQNKAGVRSVIIVYLVDLLNKDIIIDIPCDCPSPLQYLANAAAGLGFCRYNGDVRTLAEVLQAESLVAPGLTEHEHRVLMRGTTVATAIGALCVYQTKAMANLADAVAALTCEAVGAATVPFEEQFNESLRDHKGQGASASNLRAMLANSKLASNVRTDSVDNDSIRCIPQYHGPVRDTLERAYRTLTVEVNSAEAAHEVAKDGVSTSRKCPGGFHAMPISVALAQLFGSLRIVATGCERRLQQLVTNAEKYKLPAGLSFEAPEFTGFSLPLGAISQGLISLADFAAASVGTNLIVDTTDPLADIGTDSVTIASNLYRSFKGVQTALTTEACAAMQALFILETIARKEDAVRAEAAAQKAAAAIAASGKGRAPQPKPYAGLPLGVGTKALREKLSGVFRLATSDEDVRALVASTQDLLDFESLEVAEWAEQLLLAGGAKIKPKIPKGMQDYRPEQMVIREKAFGIITNVFKRHGAVTLETPVMELKSTLTGKYGEDSKLIYDLADQGGEILALRYDLTVPFARYLATTGDNANIKRYHIARVYRRDQPVLSKGRYREFYQCDFDIAGQYGLMIADADVLKVMSEILTELPIGQFEIKLNHRKLLDAILEICRVPPEKFRAICSAIDKLDKEDWNDVRAEMVNDKGLSPDSADALKYWVWRNDKAFAGEPMEMLELLRNSDLSQHKEAAATLKDLSVLFGYLQALECLHFIKLDMSLARGLDYYTGVIYEAVLVQGEKPVGSIAAGGRYDKLVGMFSSKDIPAVGVSIGIERVFTIMEARANQQMMRKNETEVYVASVMGLTAERFKLCNELWKAGFKAEMSYADKPTTEKQMKEALLNGIPFMVVIGESELASGEVTFKDMTTGETNNTRVARAQLIEMLTPLVEQFRASGGLSQKMGLGKSAKPASAEPAEAAPETK